MSEEVFRVMSPFRGWVFSWWIKCGGLLTGWPYIAYLNDDAGCAKAIIFCYDEPLAHQFVKRWQDDCERRMLIG